MADVGSLKTASLVASDEDEQAETRWLWLVAELQWAYRESEALMLDIFDHFACILCCLRGMSREEQLRHPILRWNPVWWFGILVTELYMLLGRCFHAIFQQGGPVREDEDELERKARVGWIYTYSGVFVFQALWDVVTFLQGLEKEANTRDLFSMITVGFVVEISYLGGDVHLLYRMGRQQTKMMHACVYGRMAFAGVLFGCFVWGSLAWNIKTSRLPTLGEDITWCWKLFFNFFMLLSFLGYRKLLRHRYPAHATIVAPVCQAGKMIFVVVSQFALLVLVYVVDADGLWKALTGV